MEKKTKKLLAILFTILMAISLITISGFAADEKNIVTDNDVIISPEYTLQEEDPFSFFSLFSLTEYENSYGDQLDGLALETYEAFVEYFVEKGQTGTFTINLESPYEFEAVYNKDGSWNSEGESYLETKEIISIATQSATNAFLYDYPEIFWLRTISRSYSISLRGSKGSIGSIDFIPSVRTDTSIANISAFNNAVNSAYAEIESQVTEESTNEDILKLIHDYICNKATYTLVSESENAKKFNLVHSAEGLFLYDGIAVCEGYAKALKILADRFNISNALIVGTAGGAHMWNYVKMEDGKWYLIDATWDDQDKLSKIYDTYFLANSNTIGFDDVPISQERTEDGKFTSSSQTFVFPVLSSTAYVSHEHTWMDTTVPATCYEAGSRSSYCDCGRTKSTVIPAIGHANKYTVTGTVATCTAAGKTDGVYCPDCNTWLEAQGTIPATGHAGKYTVTGTAATCTAAGKTDGVYCPDCKTWLEAQKTIPATNHAGKYTVTGKTATCTAEGLSDGIFCQDCNTWLTAQTVIPATNHKNSKDVAEVKATCTKGGFTAGKQCSDCKIWLSGHEATPATNHAGKYTVAGTPATCTTAGTTDGEYCPDCKTWLSGNKTIEAKGHIDADGDLSCDECGESMTMDCSCNCHKTGIANFFFRLILFFQKIFGMNKVCPCGIVHY